MKKERERERASNFGDQIAYCQRQAVLLYSNCSKNWKNRQENIFSPVAQQAKLGQVHLTVEVSRSHTTRLTQLVGLLRMSDRLMAQAAAYTTHNEHNR
jgi:hypothetical protein